QVNTANTECELSVKYPSCCAVSTGIGGGGGRLGQDQRGGAPLVGDFLSGQPWRGQGRPAGGGAIVFWGRHGAERYPPPPKPPIPCPSTTTARTSTQGGMKISPNSRSLGTAVEPSHFRGSILMLGGMNPKS